MEHTNNIDKALSSFKILAATQVAATENGDYKKGNEAPLGKLSKLLNTSSD